MFRHGLVRRFGHLGFGFLVDFKTKKEHRFELKDCIGNDFQTGDRVKFQLGPRKIGDRKDQRAIDSAPAINVERLD